MTTGSSFNGISQATGISILKASMPVKCIDQMPVPIANTPPASHKAQAVPEEA